MQESVLEKDPEVHAKKIKEKVFGDEPFPCRTYLFSESSQSRSFSIPDSVEILGEYARIDSALAMENQWDFASCSARNRVIFGS
jgi:hypothetical protein